MGQIERYFQGLTVSEAKNLAVVLDLILIENIEAVPVKHGFFDFLLIVIDDGRISFARKV